MTEIHGFCDERFAPLEQMFRSNLESGIDTGACLAATLHGEPVVDLWGGHSDWGLEKPWTEDTLCHVFSTSKVVTLVTLLLTYDRGLLDLDAPISEYWPEFGRHGKDAITARQVLIHRSGVPGFGRKVKFEEFHDFDHMVRLVEDAELWYEPGTQTHYSFFASGFILGELIARIAGMPFVDFFRTELRDPLGADFHYGLSEPTDRERVADLWPPEQPDEPLHDPVFEEMEQGNWLAPDAMAAVMPTVNGITNARALARLGSVLGANGVVDGRRFLSERTVKEAGTEQSYDEDPFLGPVRFGLGLGLDHPHFPAPTPTTMHWGGYGGSFLGMDPVAGISFAFVPNRLRIGDTGQPWDERNSRYCETVGAVVRTLG